MYFLRSMYVLLSSSPATRRCFHLLAAHLWFRGRALLVEHHEKAPVLQHAAASICCSSLVPARPSPSTIMQGRPPSQQQQQNSRAQIAPDVAPGDDVEAASKPKLKPAPSLKRMATSMKLDAAAQTVRKNPKKSAIGTLTIIAIILGVVIGVALGVGVYLRTRSFLFEGNSRTAQVAGAAMGQAGKQSLIPVRIVIHPRPRFPSVADAPLPHPPSSRSHPPLTRPSGSLGRRRRPRRRCAAAGGVSRRRSTPALWANAPATRR